MEIPNLCSTTWACVYAFQGLIAGIFAIFAAVVTAIVILRAAKLPIQEQRRITSTYQNRILNFRYRKLSEELRAVANRARHIEGTITVQIASRKDLTDRTRNRTFLDVPVEFDDPEIMSLFSAQLAQKMMNLRRSLLDHNLDMRRAGGAFGAQNFQESIFQRVTSIISRSHSLSGELEAESKLYFETKKVL